MEDALVLAAVGLWCVLGVYVSFTDLRHAIIPRRAVWAAGLAIAFLLAAASIWMDDLLRFAWAIAGAATLGLLLEILYWLRPGRIGFGDVRLIVLNGLLAGWWGMEWSWWALFAGAMAEWPVAMVALMREGREARVRWGPGLVMGTAATIGYLLWSAGPTG